MTNDFDDIDDDDFEELEADPKSTPDSAFDLIAGIFKSIPIKVALFLFILFVFISSDIFIDWCLGYIPGAVDHREPTTKGTLLQGLFLSLGFIIINILVNYEIV